MDNEVISQREFAKRMECDEKAVRDAIKNGKIVAGVVRGDKNRPAILFEIAKEEWEAVGGPNNKAVGQALTTDPETGEHITYAEALRRKEVANMKIKEIELAELEKKMIDTEKIQSLAFNIGREIRDAIVQLPERIIDELDGKRTRNEKVIYLTDELSKALECVANIQSRITDGSN